jgi:hypothetical protein
MNKVENQLYRAIQCATRADQWDKAKQLASRNGNRVVTPVPIANKSARRVAQRAKAAAKKEQLLQSQGPASARSAPAVLSRSQGPVKRNRSSETIRKSSRARNRSPSSSYTSSVRASSSSSYTTNAPGRHPWLNNWPRMVELYSHDKRLCCWDNNVDMPELLRLDCRPFFDPVLSDHDGRHQSVQAGLLLHNKNKVDCFLDMCKRVAGWMRKHGGRNCAIAFWCDTAKHRSVGCAELFYAILSTEPWARRRHSDGADIYCQHISLETHKLGHLGCPECQNIAPDLNPNLLAARHVWDRAAAL